MLLEKYLLFLQSEEKSKQTQTSYLIALNNFEQWLAEKKNIKIEEKAVKNIDRICIREYIDSLYQKGLKNSSRNLNIFALKSFFDWLYREVMLIKNNPIADLKGLKIPYREAEFCSYQDVGTILCNIDKRNYARNNSILSIMSVMGLRCVDLVNLNRESYFREEGNHYLKIIGKGNLERIVALSPECNEALEAYLIIRDKIITNSPALFLSERTKARLGTHAIWALIDKIRDETGVSVHPHKLRHTAGTMIYDETKDLVAVQSILGHRSINTTRRYVHERNEKSRLAVCVNPLNQLINGGKK